jgi:hypothetical protein
MTVCRRPVASWQPQSVGDSGLDRVGTRKTGVKVPLRQASPRESPGQGLAEMLGGGSRDILGRIVPAYERCGRVGAVTPTPVFRVAPEAGPMSPKSHSAR